MVIEIIPTGGTPVRLTGDTAESGVAAGRLTHDREQELLALVRGAAAVGEDRKGESHALRFTITRVHPSAGYAAFYWLTHAGTVPASGRVKFTCTDVDGSLVGIAYLNDAIICAAKSGADWQTLATTFDYEIRGGAITLS